MKRFPIFLIVNTVSETLFNIFDFFSFDPFKKNILMKRIILIDLLYCVKKFNPKVKLRGPVRICHFSFFIRG